MANNNFSHPFKEMRRQWMQFMRELPVKASNVALNHFQKNFRQQGFLDDSGNLQKWKKRKHVTKKSDEKRPVNIKTGRLKRSLRPKPSFGVARVVTDVLYAEAVNEGFTGTETVRKHTRKKFSKGAEGTGVFSVKTRKERTRSVKRASGATEVKAHSRKMNTPARPYMKTTKPLMNEMEKEVEKGLDKIFK
jgi:phage gpG-like protein